MTVEDTLAYSASFRRRWNTETETSLVKQFRLDVHQKVGSLSKGQRTQLALVAAICAEPELLVLDEPTSGLDPIVRREFIQTVIGAYQDADPERRTVLVSTHLISEFEGLIDEFTIMDGGRAVLTQSADDARERYQKIRVRFPIAAPALELKGALRVRNSWGSGWGEDGHGWLPYRYATEYLAADFWAILRPDWLEGGEFTNPL